MKQILNYLQHLNRILDLNFRLPQIIFVFLWRI
jgi:hypothetical protein